MSEEKAAIQRLLSKGVAEFVVCGGARNAVLISHLVAMKSVRVWRHFEERSAAFFALGRTKETGQPCAVITTSGTAVAECLPAVIEAYYSAKPLVIVSADRPENYRGSGAPQTIEQENIFTNYAYVGEDWNGWQPWHLNVPLTEAKTPVEAWDVPPEAFLPERKKFQVGELVKFLDGDVFRGFIVMLGGLEPDEREEVFHFLTALKAPILADVTSGLREALGDLVIDFPTETPHRILRLGEVPVGRYWRDLEDLTEVNVLSICRNGLPGLARESKVIEGEVDRVLRGFGEAMELGDINDDIPPARTRMSKKAEILESYPDSEQGLLRTLSLYATTGESLYLGNSLPIREWNEVAQRDVPYAVVRANRGANGIDGQVSTWLGASADERDAWGVFGDLTALYDLAAGSILNQVEQQGRMLVVINNGGGRIFDRLPRLQGLDQEQRQAVVQSQEVNLIAWAEMWGMDYLKISSQEDFDALEGGEKTVLVEVVPSESQTQSLLAAL